ncbi:MAG: protein kinase [Minicystis sp.]
METCSADGSALLPDAAVAAAETDLVPGQTVGEYQVEGKIGEGGFGAVYRAVHPLIGKTAAIKVLNKQYSSNPQMVSRFIAEARAVNQIRNRNIIDIFSFGGLPDGRQYYVMELLDGSPLDAYLRKKGRLGVEEALPILRGIARAIDAAHANGIAHRDLKPENVFLVIEDDGTVFPKLLDFGIAKLLGDSTASGHKTRTGAPLGTPYYMSPEQCRGRNVDHRTDLYSFGVLLFVTLTGKLPFEGEDVMDVLIKHTSVPAPKPSAVCPDLPAALDAPVLAFLEKDPALRPASLSAGLDALAQAAADAGLHVQLSGRTPGAASKSGPQVRVGTTTPGEVAGMSEARTILQEEGGKTVLSAEAAAKPAGNRAALIGMAVVVALASGIGAFRMMRGKEPPPPVVNAAVPTATATVAVKAPDPVPTVTPSATPSAVPEVQPAAAVEVELTIDATPKNVEVFLGGTKIGTAAAPIKIKRADGKVKLTFMAPGYVPRDMDVPASANSLVSVELDEGRGRAWVEEEVGFSSSEAGRGARPGEHGDAGLALGMGSVGAGGTRRRRVRGAVRGRGGHLRQRRGGAGARRGLRPDGRRDRQGRVLAARRAGRVPLQVRSGEEHPLPRRRVEMRGRPRLPPADDPARVGERALHPGIAGARPARRRLRRRRRRRRGHGGAADHGRHLLRRRAHVHAGRPALRRRAAPDRRHPLRHAAHAHLRSEPRARRVQRRGGSHAHRRLLRVGVAAPRDPAALALLRARSAPGIAAGEGDLVLRLHRRAPLRLHAAVDVGPAHDGGQEQGAARGRRGGRALRSEPALRADRARLQRGHDRARPRRRHLALRSQRQRQAGEARRHLAHPIHDRPVQGLPAAAPARRRSRRRARPRDRGRGQPALLHLRQGLRALRADADLAAGRHHLERPRSRSGDAAAAARDRRPQR